MATRIKNKDHNSASVRLAKSLSLREALNWFKDLNSNGSG